MLEDPDQNEPDDDETNREATRYEKIVLGRDFEEE